MQTKTRRLVLLALFTAIALTIFVLESLVPPPLPIPGVKLGLANVITLILLCCAKPSDALTVLLLRITLGSIFTGQMVSFSYSLAGGLFCFLVMWALLKLLNHRFIPLISIFGALAHNLGQILIAILMTSTPGIIAYLPILMFSGTATGLFTGLCAQVANHYVKKIFSSSLCP